MQKAFTLVELLIVIAILSILGIGLLVALDPIEQTRRAQDSTIQQSAVEVKEALHRYYASKLYFPWCDANSPAGGCNYNDGTTGSGCVDDDSSGNLGLDTCGAYILNQLTDSGELKSAPNANITNALTVIRSNGGVQFAVHFQPVSKSFDGNLNNLYTDATCTTSASSEPETCPANGNDCYFCVR